jgi:hypothetical protein
MQKEGKTHKLDSNTTPTSNKTLIRTQIQHYEL